MDATRQEVVFEDSLAQEVVAPLRAVSPKGGLHGHLVHRLVHGLYHCRTERLGDVADTQADDLRLGVRHLEGVNFLGNVGKQVVVGQFQEVFVY